MSAYYLAAIVEYLVVAAEYLVAIAKYSYSPIALSSRLTIGVALGSRRRADEAVGAPAREKAIASIAIGAISLL